MNERTSSPSTGSRQTKRSILFTSHQTEIDFRPSELIKRRRLRPGKHEMIATHGMLVCASPTSALFPCCYMLRECFEIIFIKKKTAKSRKIGRERGERLSKEIALNRTCVGIFYYFIEFIRKDKTVYRHSRQIL